jgi:hypothetical protein
MKAGIVRCACTMPLLFLMVACQDRSAFYDRAPIDSPARATKLFTDVIAVAEVGSGDGNDGSVVGRAGGFAIGREHVYVLDTQGPVVLAYSLNGTFQREVGGNGEGPGEFMKPLAIAVDGAGRLFVRDAASIVIYEADGRYASEYLIQAQSPFSGPLPFTVTPEGQPYVPEVEAKRGWLPNTWTWAMARYDGTDTPLDTRTVPPLGGQEQQLTYEFGDGRTLFRQPPFAPRFLWAFGRDEQLAFGYADRYVVTVEARDGTRHNIGRSIESASILPEHCASVEARMATIIRGARNIRGWSPGACPAHFPSFSALVFDWDGNVWVGRVRDAVPAPTCEFNAGTVPPPTCWEERLSLDMFDREGTLAAEVELPRGIRFTPPPVIRGDLLVARVDRDDGDTIVGIYRLIAAR